MGVNITKTTLYLSFLSLAGIIYRSYPHLFLIPRWIIEEDTYAYSISELIRIGSTIRFGNQPVLEQYLVYFIYVITHINWITLSQYVNPVIGGLTIIPVYFILKKISTYRIAIIATTIWTFSENMIYRSSVFNSTEALGLFFAMIALYIYLISKERLQRNIKIKFLCVFLVFVVLSIYSHLLPALFIIGLVSLDVFINESKKNKILASIFILLTIIFLYSPLNPHRVMMISILPSNILSDFSLSNIFLYSASDLLFGISIFFGSVILLFLSISTILIYKPKILIMYEYIFGCGCLFVVSWLIYSSYLIGPTRIIVYFILPLSYFTAILLSKFNNITSIACVSIILIIMILTSLNGVNTMLYINNTVTLDEYNFLEHSPTIRNNYYFEDWWTDVPLKDSLLLYSSNLTQTVLPNTFYVTEDHQTRVNLNSTLATTKVIINENGTVTVTIVPPTFKYILLSPRMEKSAFFLLNTKHRTVQINQPIPDIWKYLPDWKLIEEYRNIKVYKWIGIDIEG